MKTLVTTFFLVTFSISLGWTKTSIPAQVKEPASTTFENLKPEEQEAIGRMATFVILHETQARLEAFFERGDQKALSALVEPWSKEEQTELKKDLMAVPEKPKFRVQSTSLFISLKEGEVEFKVEDPFQGLFRINGHLIKINPNSKYQNFKDALSELTEVSSHKQPFSDLLLPQANAFVGVMVRLASTAWKVLRPVSAATGAAVKKKAVPEAKKIAGSFTKKKVPPAAIPKKENAIASESMSLLKGLPKEIRNAAVFGCIAFGTDWLGTLNNSCVKTLVKIPGKVLCASHLRTQDCIKSVGDLAPEIIQTDSNNIPPITAVEPLNDGKCTQTKTGFLKNVNIKLFDPEKVKKLLAKNPEAGLPSPMGVINLHLEYEKNPEEPKKLIPKTITQVLKSAEGEVIGKSIWKFQGENWTVDNYDLGNDDPRSKFLGPSRPPQQIKCEGKKLSDECKTLYHQVIGTLGESIHCRVDNAEAVIKGIGKGTSEKGAK